MAAPKLEEISHPPMDQLQGLEYCIDSNPSWGMSISSLFPKSLTHCFHSVWFCMFVSSFHSYLLFIHLSAGEAIALGFQHYILALGTAVMIPSFLVPLMGGSDVSQVSDYVIIQYNA